MTNLDGISSVILAGGKGSRMGGIDKGLLLYRGKLLLEHAIQSIADSSEQIIVSCNRNLPEYLALSERYGAELVKDDNDQFWGPLAGILAAQSVCRNKWLYTQPCDMPDLPRDVLPILRKVAERQDCDIAVCHDGDRRQNLLMLVRSDCLDTLRDYLDKGQRRVDEWQNQLRVQEVDFSDQKQKFRNINLQEDLS